MTDYQLVKYIGEDDPLMLLHGKIYAGRRLKKGWYGIIDETKEEYAYPPELFEAVEMDNMRCVVAEMQPRGMSRVIGFDAPLPLKSYDALECDGELFPLYIVYDLPRSIGVRSTNSFKGKAVKFVHMMPRRAAKINEAILQTQPGIYRLRKTGENQRNTCSYIVTLKKWHCFTLEERVHSFSDCLSGALIEGEQLDCSNQCFTIRGSRYAITYSLEAYKTSPHLRCYMEDGQAAIALLHRLGYEGTLRWARRNCPDRLPSMEKAMSDSMIADYPNPTDRFDQIVKEVKAYQKAYQKWKGWVRDLRIDGEYDPPLPPVNKYPTKEERQLYKQVCQKYGIQTDEDI